VQRLWSGLGYNNRAKRLFEASKIINELGFNKLYPNFNKLPGVGEYTKNALLSFAYDEKVLTRDTNINRILKRYFGSDLEKYSQHQFEDILFKNIISRDLNQSLMDLGSNICSSKDPKCDVCPLETHCSKNFTNEIRVKVEKFSGSNRELRGQIIKLLIETPKLNKNIIKKNLNIETNKLNKALIGLEKDGLLSINKNNVVSINSE
jgi:A/G-specific adenine glycosylase